MSKGIKKTDNYFERVKQRANHDTGKPVYRHC